MILKKIESFDFDSRNFQIKIKWFCRKILEKTNHFILTLKFSNQNQMILSCDFKKNRIIWFWFYKFSNQNQMILSCDFKEIESFDFDSRNFQIKIKWFCRKILEKTNHFILILKFSNQNQMILSCDFKEIESFDFDSRYFQIRIKWFCRMILEKSSHLILILYSKMSKNDSIFAALQNSDRGKSCYILGWS